EYEWGRMQTNDGDMTGHPNKPYWNPPPGNGYGFLVDVRRGQAAGPWTATWEIDPSREARLRAIGLPEPGTELITAWAPGIYPRYPKAAYVCARRTGEGLESTYATVLEPIDRAQARHGVRALEILNSAELTGGSTKYVDGIDVALFKADAEGDRMTFPASVPETGDYVLTVGHYLSPAYGTARLYIDGEPVGEPFQGTAGSVAPARPAELGTVHLAAGEHEVALELVSPDAEEGRYWMGLTFVGLQPADEAVRGPVEPRIVGARRLQGDREGAVGVHVVGRDGVEDRLFAALDAEPAHYGDGYSAAARLAWLRTDDRGPAQLGIIGGTEMRAPKLTMRLARDAWHATVMEVDHDAGEVVLEAQRAELPEGDTLRGQAIYFSNPRYSRNTAYHVEGIRRDGDRFRLSVREATFLLGKAVIDGPPLDANTLASLVPHDYARIRSRGEVPPEADFFAGKLLTTEDGTAATTLRRVLYGQPQQLQVDSVEGFDDGDVCYYHDVRPGDEAVILAHASLTRTTGSEFSLRANVPVTVEGATHYRLQDAEEWVPAADGQIPAGAEAVRYAPPAR
ncbi:MAG: hypothetical protein ACP5KN_08460, partial [Armatimonadota bacterium]